MLRLSVLPTPENPPATVASDGTKRLDSAVLGITVPPETDCRVKLE